MVKGSDLHGNPTESHGASPAICDLRCTNEILRYLNRRYIIVI